MIAFIAYAMGVVLVGVIGVLAVMALIGFGYFIVALIAGAPQPGPPDYSNQ